MRVLIVHNSYRQPGGEDVVAEQEARLLRRLGHYVVEYRRSNRELPDGVLSTLAMGRRLIWASDAIREISELVRRERPDISHFHNTMPMISPGAYYACRRLGVPVVQSLHNYRLLCPKGDLFRKGGVCEECLGRAVTWPGVWHGCYHDSRFQTGAVAAMLAVHRALGTWRDQVDVYIALTEFARRKLVEGGIPAEKVVLKPNFVEPDPGGGGGDGDYAIFVGRIVPQTLTTMLDAWKLAPDLPLKLVGSGAEEPEVARRIENRGLGGVVRVNGPVPRSQVFDLIRGALFLLFPSPWYETFGMATIEAFACGVPVIAARDGAMAEIVEERRTGLHFSPGDAGDLAEKVRWAASHRPEMRRMGDNARRTFEEKYSAAQNGPALTAAYEKAITLSRARHVVN